jgi:hypothetical protein
MARGVPTGTHEAPWDVRDRHYGPTVDTAVVRLGAWCDLVTEDEARQRLLAEAADDGSEDVDADVVPASGWAAFVPRPGVPVLSRPDDAEDAGEDHPWKWLSDLLRVQGIEASTEELRVLPYGLEFSDRLRARVSAGA